MVIPIKDAAISDPEVECLMNELKSGNITPIAPFDGMDIPWTQEEKDELNAVMDKIIKHEL